jgi:hypothetical protein
MSFSRKLQALDRLRLATAAHEELADRLDALEQRYDKRFSAVFDAIREPIAPSERSGRGGWGSAPGVPGPCRRSGLRPDKEALAAPRGEELQE